MSTCARIAATSALLLSLAGCFTWEIPPISVPAVVPGDLQKLPLDVAVALPDAAEKTTVKGADETLVFPTGNLMDVASRSVFPQLFQSTNFIKGNYLPPGSVALLAGKVREFRAEQPYCGIAGCKSEVRLSMNFALQDSRGAVVWETTVSSARENRDGSPVANALELHGRTAAEAFNEVHLKAAGEIAQARRTILAAFGTSSGRATGLALVETAAPRAVSDVDLSIPAGRPAGRYDVAVVIGNADYSATGTPDVDYALRDAQTMRQYLVKAFGFDPANIIYLENASLAKMSEVFGTASDPRGKLHKWVKPGLSRIFVYYVGHGAPDQQTGDGYFVPVDANPQYINASGYKLSTFYENLAQIPALKKTVVIDACFSGSSANGQLLKGVSGITARLKSEPKAGQAADLLLTSAGMNQVSSWYPEQGHSLFTYYFLKGVQGAADGNGDGRITMVEMKVYLDDQVPYMARRLTGNDQQPVLLGKDDDELVELIR